MRYEATTLSTPLTPTRAGRVAARLALAAFVVFGALASSPPHAASTEFRKVLADSVRETDPTPSPDGKWLLYSMSESGPWTNLWLRPLEGGAARQLTFEPESTRAMTPTWAPDSKSILFISSRDKNYDVYSIPVEGGDAKKMSYGPGSNRFAVYSPDGASIVFASNRLQPTALYGYNLYTMDGEGESESRPARAITSMNGSPGHPTWSPDGKWVAFVAKNIDTTKTVTLGPGMTAKQSSLFSRFRVFKVPADGGAPIQLSGVLSSEEEDEDVWPTWSPDGKWIATAKRVGGKNDVWLVDPERKRRPVQITRMGNASKPTWTADGASIYFTVYDKGSEDIWVATDLTIPPPPPETKKPTFKTVPAKDGASKSAPKSGTKSATKR
jgi:Tol biopolymer transport system component